MNWKRLIATKSMKVLKNELGESFELTPLISLLFQAFPNLCFIMQLSRQSYTQVTLNYTSVATHAIQANNTQVSHVSYVHRKQNGWSTGENWPSFILLFLHQVGSKERKEDINVIRYHSCTTACLNGFGNLLRLRTISPSRTSLK